MKTSTLLTSLWLMVATTSINAAEPTAEPSSDTTKKPTTDGGDTGDVSGNCIPGQCGCFSAFSTVEVKDVGSVDMKDLQVGQQVLVDAVAQAYEPVYAFGHYSQDKWNDFVQLESRNNHTQTSPLELTPEHLVYLEGHKNPVRADSVKVGDFLASTDGQPTQVTRILKFKDRGYFAPLLPGGKIVVDGIVASSYISLQKDAQEFVTFSNGMQTFLSQHDLVHSILTPFRMVCTSAPGLCENVAMNEKGMPTFVDWGLQVANWADQQHFYLQVPVFAFFCGLIAVLYLIEALWSCPSVMIMGGLALVFLAQRLPHVQSKKVKTL